jgi:LysM repeat protein
MSIRLSIVWLLLLVLPVDAQAAGYIVQPGDTLAGIAARYHISIRALARVNGISNINLVQAGRRLTIPVAARHYRYQVRWGDTLTGIAARFHTSVSAIRSWNPRVGAYLLAGSWLALCSGCGASREFAVSVGAGGPAPTVSGTRYVVQPGDSLSAIASRYGTTVSALVAANHLSSPDIVVIGRALVVPSAAATPYAYGDARTIIARYAAYYGLDPSLPLAVAWEESGYNENVISPTGAIGVMQVEPYTADHINQLLGLRLNMYNIDDNIHAGVYWLSVLVRYYGGNERLAIAAYYQGTRSIARVGLFRDTVHYVANVLALQARVGA